MTLPPAASAVDARLRVAALSALAAALLAGCASTPAPRPTTHARLPSVQPSAPHGRPAPAREPVGVTAPPPRPFTAPLASGALADLPGWGEEDHVAAFQAFAQACGASRELPMQEACADARAAGALDEGHAKRWFERRFRPARLNGDGVLTAYFAPTYPARARRDADFSAPVRPRPGPGMTVAPAPPPLAEPSPVADPMQLLADEAARTPPPPHMRPRPGHN